MYSAGCVEEGVIHAYRGKQHFYEPSWDCFKCIIPKGTEYIEGCIWDEIGAKKIVFVKQIN